MKRKIQKSKEPDEVPAFKRPKITDIQTDKSKSEWVQSRVEKASKSRGNRGKRTAGKLKRLTELPLDVIFEVISKLDPIDLLQLTRVSRAFRTTFMSKHMWIAARDNIPGLPDCPPDLNEAQYTSLVFEHKCQACGSSCKANSVDYALRIRACVRCFNQLTSKGSVIVNKIVDFKRSKKVQHDLFSLVPYSIWSGDPGEAWKNPARAPTWRYYAAELRAVVERYLLIQSKGDKVALETFVKERQELTRQMLESGRTLSKWAASRHADRAVEDVQTQSQRKQDIFAKLFELGYSESDFPNWGDHFQCDAWSRIINQPKQLTPKSWNIAQPKLLELLASTKVAREERQRAWNKKQRMPNLREIWPDFARAHITGLGGLLSVEFMSVQCKSIKHLLEVIKDRAQTNDEDSSLSPEPDTVEMSDLVELKDSIQSEVDLAYRKVRAYFAKHLPEESDESMLDDPTTLFACPICFSHGLLSLRSGLSHVCTQGYHALSWVDAQYPFGSVLRLIHEPAAQPIAAELLKILRVDDVQELNGRLVCGCGHPASIDKTFSFESLVTHIHLETEWHKNSMKEIELAKLTTPYTLLNDHALERLPDLIRVLPPEDAAPPLLHRLEYYVSPYATDRCIPCKELGQSPLGFAFGRKDDAYRIYHLKAKHGLGDEPEYRFNPLDSDPFMRDLY